MATEAVLQSTYRARDDYARQLGDVSPDVLASLINPSFMGGPQWPDLRQAWKTIQNGKNCIIMSDGLSDPFSDNGEASAGFGLEVLAETSDRLPPDLNASWLFNLVYEVSQNCANHGGVRAIIDKLGLISMELPAEPHFGVVANTDGAAGIMLGLPMPNSVGEFRVPGGSVKVITAKLLCARELDFAMRGGKEAREELATRFASSGTHHRSSLTRASVV